jgi:hypothetical protein
VWALGVCWTSLRFFHDTVATFSPVLALVFDGAETRSLTSATIRAALIPFTPRGQQTILRVAGLCVATLLLYENCWALFATILGEFVDLTVLLLLSTATFPVARVPLGPF